MNRMTKRACCLAMVLLMMAACGLAASVVTDIYSDAPANPTQDNVEAAWAECTADGQILSYGFTVQEPSRQTVDVLKEIFDFVEINKQPPAQYFPEETREEMRRALQGGDPDTLYMPEFFAVSMSSEMPVSDMTVNLQMNIDYPEGQTIVVVLGWGNEEGVQWKALPGQVLPQDVLSFILPQDVAQLLAGQELQMAVMAAKPGAGSVQTEIIERPEEQFVPSKNAWDIVYVEDEVVRATDGVVVDCQIIIVQPTDRVQAELEKLMAYFGDANARPIRYFDKETVAQATLMLPETNVDTLVPYEFAALIAKGYQEPYGDVMARFIFPTAFEEGQPIVALMGMPGADGNFNWMPLHAEKVGAYVEVTFSSSVLPAMMEEAGLMLIMAEPMGFDMP